MKMKQHLLASALCVLPFAASAADLPMKTPYRSVEPAPFTWTGFYLGAAVGAAGLSTDYRVASGFSGESCFCDGGKGSGGGALAGVTAGYNYQMGTVVLGVEADYSWSNAGNSGQGGGMPAASSEMTGFGTVRGRVGYAFDRALIYATGGLAFAHFNQSSVNCFLNSGGCMATFSGNRTGWTAGGGIEYALNNHFSVKAEALWADLGTVTTTVPFGNLASFKNTVEVARVGLNYKF
jgi:outer membrane immunogenic protein